MEIKTIKIDNKEYEIKVNENKTLTLTEIKKIEIKKVKLKPNHEELYFYIKTYGEIEQFRWDNNSFDIEVWDVGNGFFTQEEAEKELERRKVFQLLKDFKLQHDNIELDWDNYTQNKWCIFIDYIDKNLKIYYGYRTKDLNSVYFSSEDLAKQAIEEIGEKRIYNAFK